MYISGYIEHRMSTRKLQRIRNKKQATNELTYKSTNSNGKKKKRNVS